MIEIFTSLLIPVIGVCAGIIAGWILRKHF